MRFAPQGNAASSTETRLSVLPGSLLSVATHRRISGEVTYSHPGKAKVESEVASSGFFFFPLPETKVSALLQGDQALFHC